MRRTMVNGAGKGEDGGQKAPQSEAGQGGSDRSHRSTYQRENYEYEIDLLKLIRLSHAAAGESIWSGQIMSVAGLASGRNDTTRRRGLLSGFVISARAP